MAHRSSHGKPQQGGPSHRRRAPAADAETNGVSVEATTATPANGLTGIPQGIHWRATTEGGEGNTELDDIAVNHFLDTLAQVALSIASRKLQKGKGK